MSTETKPKRTRKPKAHKEPKAKRMSGLDAAADVLKGRTVPMTVKAIYEVVTERKLWSPKGKTPAATLYAAMIREIADKGKDSRFKKADRGLFLPA